jgi:hypothetical protein
VWPLALLLLAGAAGACSETVGTSVTCPLLCPEQSLTIRDTTITAVAFDTSIGGFPPRGSTFNLMLASSGDTMETRVVVRFDTLVTTYTPSGTKVTITDLDSAKIVIHVDTSQSRVRAPVRFELYDVDTTAADTSTAALLALFRPDRFLGSTTVSVAGIADTAGIALSILPAPLLAKIRDGAHLRVGIRALSDSTLRLNVVSANSGIFAPLLSYRPIPVAAGNIILTMIPSSSTPLGNTALRLDHTDFVIPARGIVPLLPSTIGAGGLAGRRSYLRFVIPAGILDSSTVVRASLTLTQRPTPTYAVSDSVIVLTRAIIAQGRVTDVGKALLLVDSAGAFALGGLKLAPSGSATQVFEIVNVVRSWTSTNDSTFQHAIALISATEGRSPLEIQFYSLEAAAALRPRLRLSYVPRDVPRTP